MFKYIPPRITGVKAQVPEEAGGVWVLGGECGEGTSSLVSALRKASPEFPKKSWIPFNKSPHF